MTRCLIFSTCIYALHCSRLFQQQQQNPSILEMKIRKYGRKLQLHDTDTAQNFTIFLKWDCRIGERHTIYYKTWYSCMSHLLSQWLTLDITFKLLNVNVKHLPSVVKNLPFITSTCRWRQRRPDSRQQDGDAKTHAARGNRGSNTAKNYI